MRLALALAILSLTAVLIGFGNVGTGDAGSLGATTVQIDVWNHHAYLPVKVNGSRRLWFLLDTGAGVPVTLIDSSVAGDVGLRSRESKKAAATGGSVNLVLTQPALLTVGATTIPNRIFAELPLREQSKAEGHEIDGIIGYDVLKRFTIDIDYPKRSVILSSPMPSPAAGAILMNIDGKVPHVSITIGNHGRQISAHVILDTGSDAGLLLNAHFQHENKGLFAGAKPHTGSGLGGPSTNITSNADELQIACARLRSIPVTLNLDTRGNLNAEGDSGLIGGAILDRFHIRLDYTHGWFAIADSTETCRPG